MSETVSIYCPHCGREQRISAKLQGCSTLCAVCRRGFVVPTIDPGFRQVQPPPIKKAPRSEGSGNRNRSDEREAPRRPDSREDLRKRDSGGKSSVVTIRSYLKPERSKRLDIGKTLKLDWFRRGEPEEPEEPDVFLAERDLSDEEFFDRLTAEPVARGPVRGGDVKAPPVYVPKPVKIPWSQRVDFVKLGLRLGALAVVLGLVAFGASFVLRVSSPKYARLSGGGPEKVRVFGRAVFPSETGELEGDEGAFLFFFPDRPFETPLSLGGAAPQRKTPSKDDEFCVKLAANGGAFESAGFDGNFDAELPAQGVYKILVVSANAFGDSSRVDPETVREIGKYLYRPENLLGNKFYWATKNLDSESGRDLYFNANE
ncbi:MAG: hypothetical protein IJM30_10640 [Thermoguttaceae bacterium]|nr:hypothetical protein [Thermoguttaceae bacterium]